ncbi:MAG: transcription-repair coupling factor [bacterium]|nr:transcription-repair coupling factor [bacterium]
MSSIQRLKNALADYPPFAGITEIIQSHPAAVLKGTPGCLKAFIVAALVEKGRRVLWISPRSSSREEALGDLSQILSEKSVGLLLAPQTKDDITPFETRIFRARALQDWTSPQPFALVADPAATWVNTLPSKETLDRIRISLIPGSEVGRNRLAEKLVQAGYSRTDMAENRGEFALRGFILDVFPYTHNMPLRLEFWGDKLESLRSFDPLTQRTIERLNQEALFLSNVEGESGASLASYLYPDDVLLVDEPEEILLSAREAGAEAAWKDVLENSTVLYWGSPRHDLPRIDLLAVPQEDFGGHIAQLAESLSDHAKRKKPVFIACDNDGQLERLNDLLVEQDLEGWTDYFVAHFSGGFKLPDSAPILYTDHQIFRRPRHRRTYFRLRNFSPIEHTEMLKRGDYVVHEDYGIGCYHGLVTIKVGGHQRECLQIEYRDSVKLYVRLESLKKLQKYSGREGFVPPLTRIGKGEWEKIRKKAGEAVKELAIDLVKLYAKRASLHGHPFPDDTPLQRELEATFEFDETPDQLKAIADVKRDMEQPMPMDRLVCGDVGYGKTEVALRAAFKAVLGGKQVGVLVPTTLLAQQHYLNFQKRLVNTPIELEMISRFRTPSEQKVILKRLKEGRIDFIVGTHRLLSKDVLFQNLGLLIVDEEHRFGVKHKEQLKKWRSQIDVLTLTATPIPRTLHMALIGARDMSLIRTAPQDRLPIETEIAPFSQELITGAILREIDRGGQVYFVHNRVESIGAIKTMLQRWLPEVRFIVAHGQMPEKQLEHTMGDFLLKKYDCLISTMIIESGLDLPNVNTMVVNRADRFGLAQLYQLRGRIGRSNRQAYAYLLTPPKLATSDPARRRLDAIRYCSYLGAGYQLALHDLEIRGAGEIFGAKQSGFIHAVGFDLYQKMIDTAVQELKVDAQLSDPMPSEPAREFEPKIDFPFDAFLPSDYVERPEQRVELYRRLSTASTKQQLNSLIEEVKDRYGTPPEQAHNLFELFELKLGCVFAGLPKVEILENYLQAEVDAGNGQGWPERLRNLVLKLQDEDVEFLNGNPLRLILRWRSGSDWSEKMAAAKAFLDKLA